MPFTRYTSDDEVTITTQAQLDFLRQDLPTHLPNPRRGSEHRGRIGDTIRGNAWNYAAERRPSIFPMHWKSLLADYVSSVEPLPLP